MGPYRRLAVAVGGWGIVGYAAEVGLSRCRGVGRGLHQEGARVVVTANFVNL